MIYVVTVEFANQTMEDYHRVKQGYADQPIDGLVAQVAGIGDNGLRIVGIWESKAQHDRWVTERLHPSIRASKSMATPAKWPSRNSPPKTCSADRPSLSPNRADRPPRNQRSSKTVN